MDSKHNEIANSFRAVGNALKEPYRAVVGSLLTDIGIEDSVAHNLVMDLIPLWKDLGDDKKTEAGITIAGRYRLAKFLVLMDELSKTDDIE